MPGFSHHYTCSIPGLSLDCPWIILGLSLEEQEQEEQEEQKPSTKTYQGHLTA